MTNFTELAQEATQYLRPELLLFAGKAVEGAATESGKQVVNWFRERLTSKSAAAVLEDAGEHPEDDRRVLALQQQIEILLKDSEQFRTELQVLLAREPKQTSVRQVATAVGNNNKMAQASGKNNTINIR